MSVRPPLLTEYELGRCLAGIEAVERLGKPLAEVGGKATTIEEAERLRRELRAFARRSGASSAKPYVTRAEDGWTTFGFYVQPWTLDAMAFIEERGGSLDEHLHWIQGLLFGYRPEAIGKFLRRR